MLEFLYEIYADTPYLTKITKVDSEAVKIRTPGITSGFIRIGASSIKLEGEEASIPLQKIPYGTTRVELITSSHLYKLLPIERNISGIFPVVDNEELTTIFTLLINTRRELDEIKRTTLALSEAVFRTTIL